MATWLTEAKRHEPVVVHHLVIGVQEPLRAEVVRVSPVVLVHVYTVQIYQHRHILQVTYKFVNNNNGWFGFIIFSLFHNYMDSIHGIKNCILLTMLFKFVCPRAEN